MDITMPATALGNREYSRYRFRAEVDWIDIRIVTKMLSHFDVLRKRMQVGYVTPQNPGLGGAASEFIVRFQNPKSWADIKRHLGAFTFDHPLAEPATVTAIEIALDAYSRSDNREDLVEMTARFFKFGTVMVSSNRRTSNGERTDGVVVYGELVRRIRAGYNVYVGNSKDEIRQHMYLKETDTRNGQMVELPTAERRARTEITLSDSQLPVRSLEEWKRHAFTEHAQFFNFRKLKKEIHHAMVRFAAEQLAQIGERRARPRLRPGRPTVWYARSTEADKELNALAYGALRELTRRMAAK